MNFMSISLSHSGKRLRWIVCQWRPSRYLPPFSLLPSMFSPRQTTPCAIWNVPAPKSTRYTRSTRPSKKVLQLPPLFMSKPPGLDTSIPPSGHLLQPRPTCAPAVPCRPTSQWTEAVQPYILTPSAVPFYHINRASRKYQPKVRAERTLPRSQRNASFVPKEYFLDAKGMLPFAHRNASFNANEHFL